MARKKKATRKQKDARGYSRGPAQPRQQPAAAVAASKSAAPAVSTRAHDGMKELLGQMDDIAVAGKGAVAVPPSDRFASKLSNVVVRLDGFGFTDDHIERVVRALRYDITLDAALDWLCLNLTTLEFPALFTDGELRQDLATTTTSSSLTVVQESATAPAADAQSQNILAVEKTSTSNGDDGGEVGKSEPETQREKEHKQWLLQQYEFEETEEPPDEPPPAPSPEAAVASLSPAEQRLADEERALAELVADLGNDANNYMRSKAEIKQLKADTNNARRKVAGLRKKLERERARQRQQEEKERGETEDNGVSPVKEEKKEEAVAVSATAVNKEGEEVANYGGSIFDMGTAVGTDDQKEKPENVEEETPTVALTLHDYRIPGNWTGSTPQLKLEEVLKKKKLPKAKYNKLPRHAGFVLVIVMDREQPAQKWEARTAEFRKGSSLRDYLAIQALYAFDPSLQLYRIFPPPFRDLWLSWTNEKKEAKEQAQQVQDEVKQGRLDHLMSLIAVGHSDEPTRQTNDDIDSQESQGKNQTADTKNDEDTILDDWENDVGDEIPVSTITSPSATGQRMQADFVRRQSTRPYQNMKAVRDGLPMASYRAAVLETVERNPVTILCAETGAGKSTQCAQFILEQALQEGRGDLVNMICTQPRRVVATSLAERVAEEMCDELGGLVGYQIRMESRRSARTKLLFCTTGVILRRLQDDPLLTGITHVICDEVHERAQQIDVLLIILRQLLHTTRPDLKVILMLATMETELFVSFFQGAPLISVPGRSFPVTSYYLEDLLEATNHIIEEDSRYAFRKNHYGATASVYVTTRGGEKRKQTVDLTSQVKPEEISDMYAGYTVCTRRSMERVNEEIINFDLIEDVLKLILTGGDDRNTLVAPDGTDMSKGSILIFLPGLGEIKALTERLDGSRIFRDRQRFDLIPLHSTLSSRDQRRAFLPSQPGCRKIICATNIAETSVTIPDVVYVIDTGRVREVRRNKKTSTAMLVTDWCPRSSAKQRQGRAGRVQSGVCLKLYSSTTATCVMKANNEPEPRRVPLEEICMSILASGFARSCIHFLNQAPQPPAPESVEAAMNVLYDVGAIERIGTGDTQQQSERLTPLGLHLAKLPVDVKLGKMLIFGSLFRCIDPILTIAASLSSKSPFSAFVSDAAVAKAKQRAFTDPNSDFMTYCNVWDAHEMSASAYRRFCRENYLNHIALREIGDARRQFLDLLCGIGFLDCKIVMGNGSRTDPKLLKLCQFTQHAKKEEVIHAVICAGLYPNMLRLEQTASMQYSLWHKEERIYFHSASVNAAKKRFLSSENWVLFHEKFGTPQRTSVSTTAFVHPFVLLLFGGSVVVKHTERAVIVDNWMRIGMSAQTGVILRELRKKVDLFLLRMIKCVDSSQIEQLDSSMIDGIINILAA